MSEVQTIGLIHALDKDELLNVNDGQFMTDEEKSALLAATQLESVHLTDYRAQRLGESLSLIGCEFSLGQIKNNLITRVVGNNGE